MSEYPLASVHPKIGPTDSPPLPHKNEGGSSTASHHLHASSVKPTRERRREGEGGGVARSEGVMLLRREVEDLRGRLERQGADVTRLKREKEYLRGKCKRREDVIAKMEREIGQVRQTYQEEEQRRNQHIRMVEERLKQTDELLTTRSAELSEAQTFLSTKDDLSEAEVLSIVRTLNENIYQVAVNLTEGWEKLEPPPATSRMDVDATSRPCDSLLLHLVRNRNPMGLTFLLQSCLCSMAVDMTSGWELGTLNSVYDRLSASGECNIVDPG